MVLVQAQYIGADIRHGREILHQCRKWIKTKNQKVLGANSNVCRCYRGKYFAFPHPEIG